MSRPPYLAVLDFEATCDDRRDRAVFDLARQEIIEFPIALVDTRAACIVDEFSTFVRPTQQPRLTPFCTDLTSIVQADVDNAPPINEVMVQLGDWCAHHDMTPENCRVVTCSNWDLLSMWTKQVGLQPSLQSPALFRQWVDIKQVFAQVTGRDPTGLLAMLDHAGLQHEGRHHRGLDDVRNTVRLALWLLDSGASFAETFGEAERATEQARYEKKLRKAVGRLQRCTLAAKRLSEVKALEALLAAERELARRQAQVRRFA